MQTKIFCFYSVCLHKLIMRGQPNSQNLYLDAQYLFTFAHQSENYGFIGKTEG